MKAWYERQRTVGETEFWRIVFVRGWNPKAVVLHHGELPSCRVRDRRTNEMLAGWDQKDLKSRRFKQKETTYWVVEQ